MNSKMQEIDEAVMRLCLLSESPGTLVAERLKGFITAGERCADLARLALWHESRGEAFTGFFGE
jgi:hypothetical protein